MKALFMFIICISTLCSAQAQSQLTGRTWYFTVKQCRSDNYNRKISEGNFYLKLSFKENNVCLIDGQNATYKIEGNKLSITRNNFRQAYTVERCDGDFMMLTLDTGIDRCQLLGISVPIKTKI